ADIDKAVEAAQTAFDIESPWHKLDPLSFSQHKSICRKWKHLTMLIALKPTEQTPLSALYCAAFIKETGFPPGDILECGYAIAVHAHIDKVACTSPVEIRTFTNKTKKKNGCEIFSVRRGLMLAHQIRPGSIWINTYKTICNQALFDGFKESGQEKELGRYGLEAYYKVKTVVVKLV
ncbi:unnamed protein product, partial [Rotaria sordida]